MNRLLLDQVFCLRLIQSLAHFLWQATALCLIAAIGGRLLRSRSAQVRYGWYLGVFALMALCIPLSYFLLTVSDRSLGALGNQRLRGELPAYRSSAGEPRPFSLGGTGAATLRMAEPAEDFWTRSSGSLTVVYGLGVGWMLVRLLAAVHGGQKLSTCSEPITDEAVLGAIGRAVKAMNFAYNPAVAFCRAVTVPAVVGVLQPMLLLPIAISTGLTPEQIEYVARHELAHILRYDHIVNLVQRFVEAFLFFHPAVWWVSRRIRDEREFCCDELVVRSGCESLAYAESLTTAARHSLLQQIAPVLLRATGDKETQFQRRVLSLVQSADERPIRLARRSTAFVGFGCIASLFCLASLALRIVPVTSIPPLGERLPSDRQHPLPENSPAVVTQWSQLHKTIVYGKAQEVEMLLSQNADPNIRTTQGWAPLHFAACLNRTEIIRMLLQAGADIDPVNKEGRTPLMSAIGIGTPLNATALPAEAAVEELLQRHADVNATDNYGLTPLWGAVTRMHVRLARELLERGAKVDPRGLKGQTPLQIACDRVDLPMIELLVERKADCTATDDYGRTVMHHLLLTSGQGEPRAATRHAVQILKKGGAKIDFCSSIMLCDRSAVETALKHDPALANQIPPGTWQDWRPIHWAVEAGDESICSLLLGSPYNADPNARASDGRTAMHRAVLRDERSAIIAALLKAGGNPNLGDKSGHTPLHIASINRKTESVERLVLANADPNVPEIAHRRTPLHLAVICPDKAASPVAEVVKELVSAKANVNATDDLGRTALHFACAAGRQDLVEALLEASNIDVNVTDLNGDTPLKLAIASQKADSALIDLLLKRGAKSDGKTK